MDKIISGPLVRRVSKTDAYIWLVVAGAFQTDQFTGVAKTASHQVSSSASLESISLSPELHVVMLKLSTDEESWPTSEAIFYDLSYQGASIFERSAFSENGNQFFDGPLPIYDAFEYPFFKYETNHKKIMSGSCRKPHGAEAPKGNQDALVAFDKRFASSMNIEKLPSLLFLTGDQIYADDVETTLAAFISKRSKAFFPNEVFHPSSGNASLNDIVHSSRDQILTEGEGFYSTEKSHHLMGFREYFTMYMAVWGGLNVDLERPSMPDKIRGNANSRTLSKYLRAKKKALANIRLHEKTKCFFENTWRVRRLLSHVSTYMMFDDHEVTDDWNLTAAITESLGAEGSMGQRLVTNALAAFNLCQGWGNDPVSIQRNIYDSVKPYVDRLGEYDSVLTHKVFSALNRSYTFVTPTVPAAIVLDIRTQRTFRDNNPSCPLLVDDAELENIKTQLTKAAHDGIEQLILVSPAPVYGFTTVEKAQLAASNTFGMSTSADAESWISDEQQMNALIERVMCFPDLKDCYIFSGDVHYGFSRKETTQHPTKGHDVNLWQFTSSSISNVPTGMMSPGLKLLHSTTIFVRHNTPFFKVRSPYLLPNRKEGTFLTGHINLGVLELNDERSKTYTLLRPRPNGSWKDWVYDLTKPRLLD